MKNFFFQKYFDIELIINFQNLLKILMIKIIVILKNFLKDKTSNRRRY